MYTQYFGLKENPFALPPDPRYLYLSQRHQEALAHLMYGIGEGGGFVQLTGEVGTGKTMMVRALLERLPDTVDVALVLYPFMSVREFIAAICDDLRVAYPKDGTSLKAMVDALNAFLLANHAKGRRTVLVVDEAHRLSREVLEQIRLLTNLETTKDKLLRIILVGQPELAALLARQDLRQLAQRITARYNLKALLPHETAEYVLHRCRVAGAQMALFTRAALRAAHRRSGGIPRVINILCERALLAAYARGKPGVTAPLLRRAAAEVNDGPLARPAARAIAWRAVAAAMAVGVAAVSIYLVLAPRPAPPAGAAEVVAAGAAKEGEGASTNEPGAPPTAEAPPTPTLAALLGDPEVPTDTDAAFARLFGHWRLEYAKYDGGTGCERAQQAGLRCYFESGTWNNLRQLNRPAILELYDPQGSRHHVVATELADDKVVLEFAGARHEFPLAEVDHYWYGKYLALWSPPETGDKTLRRGMRDPSVQWVREALARYGLPTASGARRDTFDSELESTVREFQRRHRLDDDGVIGRLTLIQLTTYAASATPPLLSSSADTVTR